MLVWINGPFGGGKTQTAYEIQRRLPGSVVCDPEHVGFGLHRMTPRRSFAETSRTFQLGGKACTKCWTWFSPSTTARPSPR
jgi:hypothetical protein